MESSNVFNTALIAAAGMLSGANLSQAEIFSLAVKLENDEFGGLTGGQGHMATLTGGAYRQIWLSGIKDAKGNFVNPYSAATVPLLTGNQLDLVEQHMMLVQAGKEYQDGEAVVKRTAALVNNMWTDLLRDRDAIGFPLHQEKLGLTAKSTQAIIEGDFETVTNVGIQYVEIRDTLVKRWLGLMLDAYRGKNVPEYAKAYADKVFDSSHQEYNDYKVIRDLYEELGEDGLREARLYSLDPIATLIEDAKKEGIAIMPLGAGGPGANLIAIDPQGIEHLRGFLEKRDLIEINEDAARSLIRGETNGILKGFMPFKVGKEPMQFSGFDMLGLTTPQLPKLTTITEKETGLSSSPTVLTANFPRIIASSPTIGSKTQGEQKKKKWDTGGINFNTDLINWQIKRDGNGVPLPMNLQPIETMQIEGFVPVIINMTPVSLPLLLGLVDKETIPLADERNSPRDPAIHKNRFDFSETD